MTKTNERRGSLELLTPSSKFGIYLDFLKLLGWVNLPFVAFLHFIGYKGEYRQFSTIFTTVFGVFCVLTVFCLVVSYIKAMIKKLQILVYYLISIESFILLFWFNFLGLAPLFDKNTMTYKDIVFILVPLLILFVIAMFFFYFYHKNETVVRLNHYFNNDNHSKVIVSTPLIFMCVMVGRLFFEGNASFAKILGIIIAVLLTATLPAGIMGGLFSAAYIRKYPNRKELL